MRSTLLVSTWGCPTGTPHSLHVATISAIASTTEGFSYAYLKELFVSALTRWVDKADSEGMDALLLRQAEMLRAQMTTKNSA